MHNLLLVLLLATAAQKKPSIAMTARVDPAAASQKYNEIAANLSPSAKLKLQNAAASLRNSASITDDTGRAAVTTQFPNLGNMNGADIEALAFIVLMDASKSAQEDLKTIMEGVSKINAQKQQLRKTLASVGKSSASPHVPKVRAQVSTLTPLRVPDPLPANASPADMQKRLGELDDLGSLMQMQLQMASDRQSKFDEAISNILKKIQDTQMGVLKNIK